MAYMQKIRSECQHSKCKKTATHSVFGMRNEHYGNFCKDHAEELVSRVNRREERGEG